MEGSYHFVREDGTSFLVPDVVGRVKSHVTAFPLAEANEALRRLRQILEREGFSVDALFADL